MAEKWQSIETAPKDGRCILVYGTPDDYSVDGQTTVQFRGDPAVWAANWDDIAQSFVLAGGSWLGPFIKPTHWMPPPEPPHA